MYTVQNTDDLASLSPYVIVGAGGGGEKFSCFTGVETLGFIDDSKQKQGKEFCGHVVEGDLAKLIKETNSKSVAIMLPIGAEGAALKHAVTALSLGQNVITSFRSLPLKDNPSLIKLAESEGVTIKEINSKLGALEEILDFAPLVDTEVLPKFDYMHKKPVVFVAGTSQECGKRTTTFNLGKIAEAKGLKSVVISTDEMGLEKPTYVNFRAFSLGVMDLAVAIMGVIKKIEEKEDPDIIFVEGQSSLTELGNPHPKGGAASLLFGTKPDAVVLCHRPNHPNREPQGIAKELRAVEAVQDTKVIGISVNRRNSPDEDLEAIEEEFNLPAVDIYADANGGIERLLDSICDYLDL